MFVKNQNFHQEIIFHTKCGSKTGQKFLVQKRTPIFVQTGHHFFHRDHFCLKTNLIFVQKCLFLSKNKHHFCPKIRIFFVQKRTWIFVQIRTAFVSKNVQFFLSKNGHKFLFKKEPHFCVGKNKSKNLRSNKIRQNVRII